MSFRFYKRDIVFIPIALAFFVMILADLTPPIFNMSVIAHDPAKGEKTFTLKWTYDRIFPAKISEIERKLICEDGVVRSPLPDAIPRSNASWHPGFNQQASLRLRLPNGAEGKCWYSGFITYKRIFLPDVTIKNPPHDILIEVK